MSVAAIGKMQKMGRWEPNARGRLLQAAWELFRARGYTGTTVEEIAARAGLTERTFFRYFSDKREVLFYGMDSLRDILVRAIADAPVSAGPMDAVGAALQAVADIIQENPEYARLRNAVVCANAELRERELIKLAQLAAAMAGALRDRGIPEPAASLAAETGVAVYRVAFARWISEPGQPDFPAILRESMEELRGVLGVRRAGSPVAS